MAIINQNVLSINLQANLANQNVVVVAGSMGLDTSSLSYWRLPSPRMSEKTCRSEYPSKTSGKRSRVGRLVNACEFGCAGRSLAVPFGLPDRASSAHRTFNELSFPHRLEDHRDCQSHDDRDAGTGRLQPALQGSIAVRDHGK